MLIASLFLASANPTDPDTQAQALVFIGGLTACAVIANQIMGALVTWKKLKGSDPVSDGRYTTKQEHQALRDEVVGIKSDFSALARTINQSFNDFQRSLGRLEGKIDKNTSQSG